MICNRLIDFNIGAERLDWIYKDYNSRKELTDAQWTAIA